jgi:hypothetical protein
MEKPDDRDSLSRALEHLARELRGRVLAHPQAHLLEGGGDDVEIKLRVPLKESDGWLTRSQQLASDSLDGALRNVLLHRGTFKPGRVYCLRCSSATCAHSTPLQPNQVFAGYGPSGVPRFEDLGQWLLERQEPEVDRLYRRPPQLVTHVTPGPDLAAGLLAVFQDGASGYRLWGQVVAGWFHFPRPNGADDLVALTFQVVSTQPPEGGRRFGLNLVGSGPDGEPLENLFDLAGELPWARATGWAQGVLDKISRGRPGGTEAAEGALEKRIEGLINGLARRLEQRRRARDRRTGHAQQRHRQPERPTWKAMDDLARARPEHLLYDSRRKTFVVLGERGRAHVFNPVGKLVTSIRYSPESIDRRKKNGHWRPASVEDLDGLRKRVSDRSDGSGPETGS